MKTSKLSAMRQGGAILSRIFKEAKALSAPGLSLFDIEHFFDQEIKKSGAKSSFKTVRNYPCSTCINLNEGIVHGLPDQTKLKKGDLISLDAGLIWQGYHVDMSYSWYLGPQLDPKFIKAGKEALKKAIAQARSGNHVGHLSQAIEETITAAGYRPSAQLTGHGIGRTLHEHPFLPCILREKIAKTPLFAEGDTFAVEVIYSQSQRDDLVQAPNGWTLSTADAKISGLFEQTIYLHAKQAEILTPFLW